MAVSLALPGCGQVPVRNLAPCFTITGGPDMPDLPVYGVDNVAEVAPSPLPVGEGHNPGLLFRGLDGLLDVLFAHPLNCRFYWLTREYGHAGQGHACTALASEAANLDPFATPSPLERLSDTTCGLDSIRRDAKVGAFDDRSRPSRLPATIQVETKVTMRVVQETFSKADCVHGGPIPERDLVPGNVFFARQRRYLSRSAQLQFDCVNSKGGQLSAPFLSFESPLPLRELNRDIEPRLPHEHPLVAPQFRHL